MSEMNISLYGSNEQCIQQVQQLLQDTLQSEETTFNIQIVQSEEIQDISNQNINILVYDLDNEQDQQLIKQSYQQTEIIVGLSLSNKQKRMEVKEQIKQLKNQKTIYIDITEQSNSIYLCFLVLQFVQDKENLELRQQLQEMQQQIQEQQQTIEEQSQQLTESKQTAQQITKDNEEQTQILQQELDEHKQSVEQMTQEIEQYKQDIQTKETDNETIREQCEEYKAQIDQILKEKEEIQKQFNELQTQQSMQEQLTQQQIQQLESTVKQLEEQNDQYIEEKQRIQEKYDEQVETTNQLQKQILEQNSEQNKQIMLLKEQIQNTTNETLQQIQQSLTQQVNESTIQQQLAEQQRTRIQELEQQIKTKDEEIQKLNKQIKTKQTSEKKLQQQVKEQQETITKQQKKIKQFKQKIEENDNGLTITKDKVRQKVVNKEIGLLVDEDTQQQFSPQMQQLQDTKVIKSQQYSQQIQTSKAKTQDVQISQKSTIQQSQTRQSQGTLSLSLKPMSSQYKTGSSKPWQIYYQKKQIEQVDTNNPNGRQNFYNETQSDNQKDLKLLGGCSMSLNNVFICTFGNMLIQQYIENKIVNMFKYYLFQQKYIQLYVQDNINKEKIEIKCKSQQKQEYQFEYQYSSLESTSVKISPQSLSLDDESSSDEKSNFIQSNYVESLDQDDSDVIAESQISEESDLVKENDTQSQKENSFNQDDIQYIQQIQGPTEQSEQKQIEQQDNIQEQIDQQQNNLEENQEDENIQVQTLQSQKYTHKYPQRVEIQSQVQQLPYIKNQLQSNLISQENQESTVILDENNQQQSNKRYKIPGFAFEYNLNQTLIQQIKRAFDYQKFLLHQQLEQQIIEQYIEQPQQQVINSQSIENNEYVYQIIDNQDEQNDNYPLCEYDRHVNMMKTMYKQQQIDSLEDQDRKLKYIQRQLELLQQQQNKKEIPKKQTRMVNDEYFKNFFYKDKEKQRIKQLESQIKEQQKINNENSLLLKSQTEYQQYKSLGKIKINFYGTQYDNSQQRNKLKNITLLKGKLPQQQLYLSKYYEFEFRGNIFKFDLSYQNINDQIQQFIKFYNGQHIEQVTKLEEQKLKKLLIDQINQYNKLTVYLNKQPDVTNQQTQIQQQPTEMLQDDTQNVYDIIYNEQLKQSQIVQENQNDSQEQQQLALSNNIKNIQNQLEFEQPINANNGQISDNDDDEIRLDDAESDTSQDEVIN